MGPGKPHSALLLRGMASSASMFADPWRPRWYSPCRRPSESLLLSFSLRIGNAPSHETFMPISLPDGGGARARARPRRPVPASFDTPCLCLLRVRWLPVSWRVEAHSSYSKLKSFPPALGVLRTRSRLSLRYKSHVSPSHTLSAFVGPRSWPNSRHRIPTQASTSPSRLLLLPLSPLPTEQSMPRDSKYAVDVHNQKEPRGTSISSRASRSTMSRPISTYSTGYETDSSTGSMWSTQQAVQTVDTKTKINNKGQFVTVINHKQQNRQEEPSPTYKSAQTYGKRGQVHHWKKQTHRTLPPLTWVAHDLIFPILAGMYWQPRHHTPRRTWQYLTLGWLSGQLGLRTRRDSYTSDRIQYGWWPAGLLIEWVIGATDLDRSGKINRIPDRMGTGRNRRNRLDGNGSSTWMGHATAPPPNLWHTHTYTQNNTSLLSAHYPLQDLTLCI